MDQAPAPGLLESVSRYRWMVLLIVVLTTVVSAGVGVLLAPRATATATIGLTTPSATNVLVQGAQTDASLSRYASQRALFATSDDVLTIAASHLPGTSLFDLQKNVTVTPSATSTSMVVTANGSSPEAAVATVDAVVDAYTAQTTKQVSALTTTALNSIDANITQVENSLKGKPSLPVQTAAAQTLAGLTKQASDLQTDSAIFGDGVQFVQAASLDTAISHKIPYTAVAVGLLLGLALGATLAWLRADRNRIVSQSTQVEPILHAPLLGELGYLGHPVRSHSDRMAVATASREILAPLLTDSTPGVILVSGATRKVGATTSAFGLATAAAAEGLKVLVIDADTATGNLSRTLDIPRDSRGLLEAATGGDPSGAEVTWDVAVGGDLKLSAMACGQIPSNGATVTAAGVRELLSHLSERYDVIVIDAPTPGSDYLASVVAAIADATIVVVPRNAPAQPLVDLRRHLELSRARIAGYVFIRLHRSRRHPA
jgi:Mrp family chromosome partitioning ATPase